MMPSYNFVYDFAMANLQQVKVKGKNFVARCPLCGDSAKNIRKKRFNLKFENEKSIFYHCFNCNASGSFISLYARIKGITDKQAYREISKKKIDNIKKNWEKPNQIVESVQKNGFFNEYKKDWIGINDKPKGVVQTEFQKRLLSFLYKRRLPKSYPFYIATGGFYKNRIIVPVFDGDKNIIYFQGRSLDNNADQKYLNPTLTSKKMIIMNEHSFDPEKYIVITEGIFDACLVGNQGTCCFGSSIDDDFLAQIKTKTKKGIIIALDNDKTGKSSIKKIIKKSRYAAFLRYFKMPFDDIKDINELVIKKNIGIVYDFILKNSLSCFEYKVKEKL